MSTDKPGTRSSYLEQISIHLSGRQEPFGLRAADGADSGGTLLETEALRWTYVLRSRERWVGSRSSQEQHEEQARLTLRAFGLDDPQIAEIGGAETVIVRMLYKTEAEGWEGRAFPWEYVLAAATRRYRLQPDGVAHRRITVMREIVGPITATIVARKPRRFLFVQSAPGDLQDQWSFAAERDRLHRVLGKSVEFDAIENPTPQELTNRLKSAELDIVHFTGFSNAQGLRELSKAQPHTGKVRIYGQGETEIVAIDGLLAGSDRIKDGYLMSSDIDRLPMLVTYQQLPSIFVDARSASAQDPTRPRTFLVSLNLENSAARVAPLLVGAGGALAALGFQDILQDDFSETFFELLYSCLVTAQWNLPVAFRQAWSLARSDPRNMAATGSGIALWGGTHLLPQLQPTGQGLREGLASARRGREERSLRQSLDKVLPDRFEVKVIPHRELNYSVLHNRGRLFNRFEIKRAKQTSPTSMISVDVDLHLGSETASFARVFPADRPQWNLAEEVHMPLTAAIIRSAREAVNSSLDVRVAVDGEVTYRDTHRMRLLPVDQWRDNDSDGMWLPSFVQPRDPAVVKAVEEAQRYVRVLRDDPNAGFEGYQAAPRAIEGQMREIDLQVQAIWATLLHDWRLGYINPPPTYSGQLDSQRLRRPTTILESRSGTCIDLALLLAACLELVDIYPVIFLLKGHALPGYWRHDSYQADYSVVKLDDPRQFIAADESTSTSSGAQRVPWRVAGGGGGNGYKEVMRHIRLRHLVPIETVRLTENCGFAEAIEAGIEALSVAADFDSMLDIVIARTNNVTPLPISGEGP